MILICVSVTGIRRAKLIRLIIWVHQERGQILILLLLRIQSRLLICLLALNEIFQKIRQVSNFLKFIVTILLRCASGLMMNFSLLLQLLFKVS